MKDYTSFSYWLETCGDDLTPRPALSGSVNVDVAILGAGYSGLWTAYYLLARQPSLKIAVVEKEIAGFGASGRNGSWCTAHFPVNLGALSKHYGREKAVALYRRRRMRAPIVIVTGWGSTCVTPKSTNARPTTIPAAI